MTRLSLTAIFLLPNMPLMGFGALMARISRVILEQADLRLCLKAKALTIKLRLLAF